MTSNDIIVIDNNSKRQMLLLDEDRKSVYEEDFSINLTMHSFVDRIVTKRPMRSEEHRLLHVTSGQITHTYNFQPYTSKCGDLVLMPLNYIMTVEDFSPDFDAQVLTFKFSSAEYAGLVGFRVMQLSLDAEEQEIVESFFRLIAELAKYRPSTPDDVEHLIVSLLFFVRKMNYTRQGDGNPVPMSAGEVLTSNFLRILAEPGAPKRNVEYYAERLCVSANHLQTTVKKQTNLTVMQWVNNKTVAMIEGLLQNKEQSHTLAEIANITSLGDESSLSRFFKKETGLSPSDFRKKVQNIL